MGGVLGSSIRRREDPSLVTGKGKYTDDLKRPNMVYASIVRSPYAHAHIKSIEVSQAVAAPGVIDVFTHRDVADSGVGGQIPVGWLLPGMKTPVHPMLAVDTVRYAGEAVAVVVAETRAAARDAIDLVEIDYEPLPASVDTELTTREGAVQIHEDAPHNIAFDWNLGDEEGTEAALSQAPHVVSLRVRNNRVLPFAIEPRCALAEFDDAKGFLTIWMTSQNPHIHRLLMSLASLGLPEHRIRVIAPEVGGGFGSKIHHYADEAITAWCSMQVKRPVKWTATRSEANMTDAHGRDHVTEARLGLSAEGKIVALQARTYASMGAYLSTFAPAVPTYLYGTLMSGEYDIPHIHVQTIGTFTNTAPVDAVRGAGRPEATFVVERIMDLAADELSLDPAEIRRRNFVPADSFPYQTQVALQYDSGNYEPALDKALEMVGYAGLREEQKKRLTGGGKLLGIGLSSYIEACGLAPSAVVGSLGAQAGQWECGEVRFHPTGSVTAYTGSSSHGQGHETTFAQILSDRLGVDVDNIDIVHGDTEEVAFGWGTYGSRSAAVGGSALAVSAEKIVEKGRKIAAHLLEAAEEDVIFEDGRFAVKGVPDKAHTIQEIALQAHLAHNLPEGMEPGLRASTFYDPPNFTYPFGTHVAVVEVDPDTGKVDLLTYTAVDDVGNVINPMIVDGQLHGGITHGIGQCLFEEAVYDENGQLVAGELLDYALPKAHMLVSFDLDRTVTPCPHNPLGVKGCGEAGAIASPAAVANAVIDALSPFGVKNLDMPLTPEKVWNAMQEKGRS